MGVGIKIGSKISSNNRTKRRFYLFLLWLLSASSFSRCANPTAVKQPLQKDDSSEKNQKKGAHSKPKPSLSNGKKTTPDPQTRKTEPPEEKPQETTSSPPSLRNTSKIPTSTLSDSPVIDENETPPIVDTPSTPKAPSQPFWTCHHCLKTNNYDKLSCQSCGATHTDYWRCLICFTFNKKSKGRFKKLFKSKKKCVSCLSSPPIPKKGKDYHCQYCNSPLTTYKYSCLNPDCSNPDNWLCSNCRHFNEAKSFICKNESCKQPRKKPQKKVVMLVFVHGVNSSYQTFGRMIAELETILHSKGYTPVIHTPPDRKHTLQNRFLHQAKRVHHSIQQKIEDYIRDPSNPTTHKGEISLFLIGHSLGGVILNKLLNIYTGRYLTTHTFYVAIGSPLGGLPSKKMLQVKKDDPRRVAKMKRKWIAKAKMEEAKHLLAESSNIRSVLNFTKNIPYQTLLIGGFLDPKTIETANAVRQYLERKVKKHSAGSLFHDGFIGLKSQWANEVGEGNPNITTEKYMMAHSESIGKAFGFKGKDYSETSSTHTINSIARFIQKNIPVPA